jgi:hypothetical protein
MIKKFLLVIIFISGFILGGVFSFHFFSIKNNENSLLVKKTPSLTPISIQVLTSPSITIFSSFPISPTPPEINQSGLPAIRIYYQNKKDWATYIDLKGGFSFQYENNPSGPAKFYEKINDFKEGEFVDVFSCFTPNEGPFAGNENCSFEYTVKVYYNYTGGSRRIWLINNLPFEKECDISLYPRYYADVYLGNKRGLLYTSECEGSFGVTYLLFPKAGSKMIVVLKDSHSIDLDKKKIKINDFFYETLSTFKFE